MTLNPLDDLLSGNFHADVPRLHTSGRRESRTTQTKGYYRPRPDGKEGTLPIKRAEPKRGGLSKKEWKKLRRKAGE